eukprot:XP_001708005.1 Hypothetical protein GL50803_6714 [Giardia lamblia ATCC 50803]
MLDYPNGLRDVDYSETVTKDSCSVLIHLPLSLDLVAAMISDALCLHL